MQPGRTTNTGGRTVEVVAAAPRCQLLLIMLMAAMLLPGIKVSPLLVRRKIARTIALQENIGKDSSTLYYEDATLERRHYLHRKLIRDLNNQRKLFYRS
ncbi:hypothetical protein STEG23_017142 [Scotinomys teguina]